jgi:preprotein translocase subunit YajC
VLSVMLDLLFWLQPDATGVPDAGSGAAPGGGGGAAGCGAGDPSMFMLIGMFALMYFLIIAPQRKQQKKHETMLKALKKGDVVRTDSGIRGEILSLTDREAVLLVDVKTKINVLRTRIASPEAEGSAEKSEKPKDDGEKDKDKAG